MPQAENSPSPQRAGITIGGVSKSFRRGAAVLDRIDLAVRPGEFLCLLGPSGCGKTTLLRCVAGLEQPDQGRIAIGDRVVVDAAQELFVPPEKRRLGMVFQHYALWPHMTVEENIGYPLRKQGVKRAERAGKIAQIVKTVGLPDLLDRRPSQLSGGQQQRVALARALVYEPPVLLLDEPLSNLDATLRAQLRRELRQLHERLGTTTVLVTHDQEEASALADTIAVMHYGRIVQIGTAAEVLNRPSTRFVAEFVGFDNFISGRIADDRGDRACIVMAGAEIELPSGGSCPPKGTRVVIAARSDSLLLLPAAASTSSCLRGTIRRVARGGRGIEFEIAVVDQIVIVREAGFEHDPGFAPGASVAVDFQRSRSVIVVAHAENTGAI